MRVVSILWIPLVSMVLGGCGGLRDTWEGPGAESFHPSSIAVLPPIEGSFEGSREPAYEVMTKALRNSGRYAVSLEREQVTAVLANSNEFREAVTRYVSTFETSGISDKELAGKLGQALKVEALLFVKVNGWEYMKSEGDKIARVALELRLIDAQKGTMVWKARHEERKNYTFFKPSLKDMAGDLAGYMVRYMPH